MREPIDNIQGVALDRLRIGELPLDVDQVQAATVPTTEIATLTVRGTEAVYLTVPPATLEGGLPGERSALHVLQLASGRDQLLSGVTGPFALSSDGHTMLSRDAIGWKRFRISDAAPVEVPTAVPDLTVQVDPQVEWREMFEEAWRLTRDQFADPKLNGVDWEAVHDRYASLLPRLGSRDDLNWLLTAMLGEVGSSHFRVAGGDDGPPPSKIEEAVGLGADLVADPIAGRYRFLHVYHGDLRPDDPTPLGTATGVSDGDLLVAIDGRSLTAADTLDALLAGVKGPNVTLTVSRGPAGKRRDVVVTPTDDESLLRQADWIESRRTIVDRLSGGRIGYIHLIDMGETGAEQFGRQFHAALGKSGLVIDVRYNRGGYRNPMLVEHLLRRRYGNFVNRGGGREGRPSGVIPGPKAVLINGYSVSDAENFAQMFQQAGLGSLVGTRTMGGVLGVAGAWHLLDGGTVAIPFSELEGDVGQRMIEGRGVLPTIAVDDLGANIDAGQDPQLVAAVSDVMRRVENG